MKSRQSKEEIIIARLSIFSWLIATTTSDESIVKNYQHCQHSTAFTIQLLSAHHLVSLFHNCCQDNCSIHELPHSTNISAGSKDRLGLRDCGPLEDEKEESGIPVLGGALGWLSTDNKLKVCAALPVRKPPFKT